MSFSFNSSNNEFTPTNQEIKEEALVEKNREPISDREQLKEFRKRIASMESEFKETKHLQKISKLEIENKELQEKLKHQQLTNELKALHEKVAKLEQEKQQQREREEQGKYVYTEQFKAILEKIGDLEKRQQKAEEHRPMASAKNRPIEKFETVFERVDEIEKQQKAEKQKYVSASGQFDKILERMSKLEKQLKPQQQIKQEKAKYATVEKLEEFFARFVEMEKQQQQKFEQLSTEQQKNGEKMAAMENFFVDLFSQLQNDQKTELYARIDQFAQQLKLETDLMDNGTKTKVVALEKQQKKLWDRIAALENFIGILKDRFGNELLKAVHPHVRHCLAEKFSNPLQNCWEIADCHTELEIFGSECLRIHFKGDGSGICSVFSKYSVPCSDWGLFCFEIKITNVKSCATIGLATKAMPLDAMVGKHLDSCGYRSDGQFWINDSCKNGQPKFARGDLVGCGINLATRRIIFTKNGKRLDTTDLFLSPSSADPLFPCLSLCDSGDLVEANFGPDFKFDFASTF